MDTTTTTTDRERIKEAVRTNYAATARGIAASADANRRGSADAGDKPDSDKTSEAPSSCCGTASSEDPVFGSALYENLGDEDLPDSTTLASLGCGNPTAVADLNAGETVLDLGSGAGLDVMLSAKRVGPTGKAYGLDMTDEMLELARRNQAEAGIDNVEFLKGDIENIPLPDDSVDIVISNCVINLSADKDAVFAEAARVLVPGGRIAVTDVIATRPFTDAEKADVAEWAGCITGALIEKEYVAGLASADFSQIEVEVTHPVANDAVSAIVRAVRD